MLKNKIYKYFFDEILKNFIIILFTFATIAWVVRAVNFLDLMVNDGYSVIIYFKYTVLNFTTIINRFIPLAFLLSLTSSIIKFERQKEFLILWTTGLNKIKIVHIFLVIGFFITLFQIILSLFLNPLLLNKSRFLLSGNDAKGVNAVLKSNDFSDSFKDLTFYIDKKTDNNELQNIFIKDSSGSLNTVVSEIGEKKNSTIIAERGFVINNKLILFNGMIQTLNYDNEIKNIFYDKTELSLKNISTRTIKIPKIQETSSILLLRCVLGRNSDLKIVSCSEDYRSEAIQALSRRLGIPLYIPLITIITSFLIIYKKEKTYNFIQKYILFLVSFLVLIFSEIFLRYTGSSLLIAYTYFIIPLSFAFLFYIYLLKKIVNEKIMK